VTKKLIPRNTTIPVRRSDVFSTGEDNQTLVEVHVLQGEREMASDNTSLGRFKLMGIPPAPRGVPQITVSLDVDANGILQVTAMDKTTGREQGITIQGSANLSETDVNQMIQEAEQFADFDRERRERIEKRNQAEALTIQSERLLREVALDFGLQFANQYRRRIEKLSAELKDCLKRNDERGIDIAQADLKDAIYELNKEVYQIVQTEEEEEGILGAIKRTIVGDDLYDPYYDSPRGGGYRDDGYRNDGYRNDGYRNDSYGYRNDSYRDDRRDDRGGYRNDNYRDNYRDDRGSYRDREGGYPNDRDSYRSSDRPGPRDDYYGDRPGNDSRRRPPRDIPSTRRSGRYGNAYDDEWDDDDEWL
ncbi:MAG: Hsp70 family protein, partial [Merismopedia sp. SIO2A8]|nr:Hsp70 family protein [Merismopedia sp. SIO2A8]